jgi:hypothetical protein
MPRHQGERDRNSSRDEYSLTLRPLCLRRAAVASCGYSLFEDYLDSCDQGLLHNK